MTRKHYLIDGGRFSTLAEAAAEFTKALGLTTPWHGNLNAFNDFLHGGFGTPEEGFVLVWEHSSLSQERLGFEETALWLEQQLRTCHPSHRATVQGELVAARRHEGRTLFDIMVEIIRDHEDIELRLE